jgi:hypothetical protein
MCYKCKITPLNSDAQSSRENCWQCSCKCPCSTFCMQVVEQRFTICFEQDRLRLSRSDSLIWIVSDLHFDPKVALFFICGIKIFLSVWLFSWPASNNRLQTCTINQYYQTEPLKCSILFGRSSVRIQVRYQLPLVRFLSWFHSPSSLSLFQQIPGHYIDWKTNNSLIDQHNSRFSDKPIINSCKSQASNNGLIYTLGTEFMWKRITNSEAVNPF